MAKLSTIASHRCAGDVTVLWAQTTIRLPMTTQNHGNFQAGRLREDY